MKNYTKTTLAVAMTLAIAACGGGSGSSDNSATSATMKGKAIDGYIHGATVFLDYNFNNKLDANEPRTVTGESGDFSLSLEDKYAQCIDYVPVVVDVPVGAVDEDLGTVTNAYQMVIPPREIIPSDGDIANVTPLTTVLWNSIQTELAQGNMGEISCASIRDNTDTRTAIQSRLQQQEWRLANRYSVTAEELYSDFIASGNTSLHQTAMDLVPAMQKSYEATREIAESNPNADVAYVEYYHGHYNPETQTYDDKWYKKSYLSMAPGQWTTKVVEMHEDLEREVKDIYLGDMMTVQREGFEFEYTKEFEEGRCSVVEYAQQTTNPGYGLRNSSSATGYNNLIQCETMDVEATLQGRTIMVKKTIDSQTSERGEFVYHRTNLTGFDHLVNMRDTLPTIAATDFDAFNYISPDYSDVVDHGADVAMRSETYRNAPLNVYITRDVKTDKYAKNELNDNGISKDYCSVDGVNWTETADFNNCF